VAGWAELYRKAGEPSAWEKIGDAWDFIVLGIKMELIARGWW